MIYRKGASLTPCQVKRLKQLCVSNGFRTDWDTFFPPTWHGHFNEEEGCKHDLVEEVCHKCAVVYLNFEDTPASLEAHKRSGKWAVYIDSYIDEYPHNSDVCFGAGYQASLEKSQ